MNSVLEKSRTAGLRFAMPAGACDSHIHVFGPYDIFPLAPGRSYTPPEASLLSYRQWAQAVGLQRVVFVQATPYGADNRCLLNAMAKIGPDARGVVAIGDDTSAADLNGMDKIGVRGVRVTLNTKDKDSPDQVVRAIENLSRRVTHLGWHIQIFASLASLVAAADAIRNAPVPIVVDHMGLAKPGDLGTPAFKTLLDLLASGKCWVKLSGADRSSGSDTDFSGAVPIMRALVEANSDRLVWGSDWPHPGQKGRAGAVQIVPYRDLDDVRLLDVLADGVADPSIIRRVLVDNPARLYGFPASAGQ